MGENKQVSIARHGYFYQVFFIKHGELIQSFLDISFQNIIEGYKKLNVFYASYSYWIKEDDQDDYVINYLNEKKKNFLNNEKYNKLIKKYEKNGLKSFTYQEFKEFNDTFNKELINLLNVLELFNTRLAPNDMMPNLTEMHKEYDRQLAFVIYDSFYEKLYNIHAKIIDQLMSFSIIETIESYKYLLAYYHGYNYYLSREKKKEIKNEFEELFNHYNSKEFLSPFFRFINLKSNDKDYNTLQEYKELFFNRFIRIFEKINAELPKSNIMPKKQDKILVDDTLI
ncbi:MAG: hypothetical protein ACOC56_02095 [Atribacterota bacterium]